MAQPALAPEPPLETQPGRQWGRIAFLLSCFLIFLFPLMGAAGFAGIVLGALSTPVVDEHTLREYVLLGKLVLYCLIGAAALALVFGLLGLRSARLRRQPAGWAVAGTSVAVIALVLQVLLLLLLVQGAEDMIRVKKDWYDPAFKRNEKSKIPAVLTVVNETDAPASLYWLTGDKEVFYCKLNPGQRHQQFTFLGHTWRARIEGKEKPLEFEVATEETMWSLR